MPINIPDGLPAKKTLQEERIFALEEEVAEHQEIRPLRLAILNLMPKKIQTETQILRLISKSPIQVTCDFMRISSHESKNTAADHLVTFYSTFDDFKNFPTFCNPDMAINTNIINAATRTATALIFISAI